MGGFKSPSSAMQLGFGWTNGVALQLLDRYGATLTSGSGSGGLSAFLLCLVVAPLNALWQMSTS